MISALGILAAWGICLFLIFGLVYVVAEENDARRFIGKMSLRCLLVAVVSSVLRELLL